MKSPEQWGPGCKPCRGGETQISAAGQISAPLEGGGWLSHNGGITDSDPTTRCSRNHLRAAWGGICVTITGMSARTWQHGWATDAALGAGVPRDTRAPGSAQGLAPGVAGAMAAVCGQQKGEVPIPFARVRPCHELPAADKGAHEDTQGLDPSVVLCDGRVEQGLCSTA